MQTNTLFKTSWSHGKYLDYWSIIHFLTGIILGIGTFIISLHPLVSFILIFILLSSYEWIEMLVRVSEGFENILLDVIIGSLGAGISIFVLPEILSEQNILGILSLAVIANLIYVYHGWKNFLKVKAARAGSYTHILYTLYGIYILGILIIISSSYFWFTA